MKVRFLGTGNAIGIPAPFCDCKVCKSARLEKGKEVRSRSSIIIDDTLIIDIGPDIYHQSLVNGLSMAQVENVLITHTHSDHFSFSDIFGKVISYGGKSKILNVYMSEGAYVNGMNAIKNASLNSYASYGLDSIKYQSLKLAETVTIGDYNVTPVCSTHFIKDGEYAYNYIIQDRNGTTILYGTDTSKYDQETLELLYQFTFDLIIFDVNNGIDQAGSKNHGNFIQFQAVVNELKARDCVNENTRLIGTHLTHDVGMSHEEYKLLVHERIGEQYEIAYDGLMFFL